MACSVDGVKFREGAEDCALTGDEDGNGAADCEDLTCAATVACAGTCTDQQKNGDESDVDCGGRCGACADSLACADDGDCASGLCGKGACARATSCKGILDGGYSRGDGVYSIDPDGAESGAPFAVKCDMTSEGGGWTRFHWVTAAYPANADPFEHLLSQCSLTDPICRGRIPVTATPTHFMIKDLGDGDLAVWQFDGSVMANTVLAAFRDKALGCVRNQTPWQPIRYTGTEVFCGSATAGNCRAFVYTTGPGCGGNNYTGWYTQMDDDTGCYATAFKLGMTHTTYETIGCEMPDANFLDEGPATDDDRTGELYYR